MPSKSLNAKKHSLTKQKRLGQYFSGDKLAKLLSSFALPKENSYIIDPMCGIGDMLLAPSFENGKLVGIDIDKSVLNKLQNKSLDQKEELELIHGSAFDISTLKKLPAKTFDLVITNPPYVRYQNLNKNNGDYPTSEQIRENLLYSIDYFDHLDKEDQFIFKQLIKGYSGLSDLAVPSWILCALLTKEGGRMALVVPESWLNRDYAYIIQYILTKYFEIEYVIEDLDRQWFEDAQVKTNLIVAKRIQRINNLKEGLHNQYYYHIEIPKELENDNSIVGSLYPNSSEPEYSFFKDINTNNTLISKRIVINKVYYNDSVNNLLANINNKKWFLSLQNNKENNLKKNNYIMPQPLQKVIDKANTSFCTLEDLGAKVGQGLRSGSNKFFYVDLVKSGNIESTVKPHNDLSQGNLNIKNEALKTVLRKQIELDNNYLLNKNNLSGKVLLLNNLIKSKDYERLKGLKLHPSREIMTTSLEDYLDSVEGQNVGTIENPKYIPQLSAVKPNIKPMKNFDPDTESYWYILPGLTKRHTPDIFVPRVNNGVPKFRMNSHEKAVIDANFSTIWLDNNAEVDKYFLVAVLNSEWAIAACELIGSVMGGGALKLEATHLRKIPIPNFSVHERDDLSMYGYKLINGETTINEINEIFFKYLFSKEHYTTKMDMINEIIRNRLHQRTKK